VEDCGNGRQDSYYSTIPSLDRAKTVPGRLFMMKFISIYVCPLFFLRFLLKSFFSVISPPVPVGHLELDDTGINSGFDRYCGNMDFPVINNLALKGGVLNLSARIDKGF
jgi:hypothetical protein